MEKFKSKITTNSTDISGTVSAKCPSNIALIKYWGKKDVQIPMNPSLSFTLNNSYTQTELKFKPQTGGECKIKVFLDNELKEDFAPKIITFFKRIEEFLPFLNQFEFEINTQNTFPHSSGIASSASGMGALALCLTEMENHLGVNLTEEEKLKKASFL